MSLKEKKAKKVFRILFFEMNKAVLDNLLE